MALGALSQRHNVSRRWNGWTLMTLMLVASSFWIPASNAATLPRRDLQPRAIIADGIDLRILPIGDSITHGSPDEPWRSYRGYLWDMLIETNNVDYVGAEKSGTGMVDQDHEGHRGQFITKIRTNSSTGIYAAPNIALLHAGTNDMKEDEDILNAPSRIKILVDYILEHSEDAVVLVAQIIPSTYNGVQAKIDNFNDALVDIVDSLVSENKKVALVAMNEAVSTSDLQDGLHPTEEGYEKMADAWYAAIQAADAKGWITEAGEAQDPPDSTDSSESCQSTPSWYDLGTIAKGPSAAYSNGEFVQNWVKIGVVAEGACDRSLLHFMDLDGDGLKDYACVNKKNGSTRVHLNIADSNGKTSGLWNELGMIATGGSGRKGAGVRFADLNGDGRDDYIWVDSRNGAVYAWINRGANDDGSWAWQALGVVASGVGANTTNLQLADINGDGRADFCIVDPTTGTVTAWINNGASYKPDWYKVGVIATGASASQGDTVFLGDFTGEGRADYMIVGEGGKVTGLVNRRQETTLIPGWMTAVTVAEGPDGVEQEQVRLVDMTGDGKVDYLAVGKEGKVTLWENTGTGGTYQPGDGVVLCDLNGDKAMDYFWLSPSGKGWVYLNTGKGTDAWKSYGQTAAGVGYDREFIRMGVLTKSGRADYIVLDEDTGRALWWQNLGEDYKYNWAERGECATGPKNTIETKFGWKFNAKNVRFADLNNDGLDDYLYINETGAVVMWAHQGGDEPSFANPTLVADGVGALPQDIHFADTNGDGRLDYVVVGRATGLSRSWHHLGFRDDGSIRWNTPLSFADGTGAVGSAVMIVDMTGEGRADYVTVEPGTGRLNLTKNRCLAIDSDDDNTGGNKPWLGRTESEWCDIANQTGLSPAQKSYVWGSDGAGLGVGQWLDEKIASDGDKDWLKTIRDSYKDVLGGQYLKNLDCTSLEGDCNFLLLPNCTEWADRDAGHIYWIFRAVSYVNKISTRASTKLVQQTLRESMNLSPVWNKFGKDDGDTTAMDLLTWGLGAASSASSASAGTSAIFDGLTTVASLAQILGPTDEDDDSIVAENALAMLYDSTQRGLDALVSIVARGYYNTSHVTDGVTLTTSNLPNLEEGTYDTSLGMFFQAGRWLLDSDRITDNMDLWAENFTLRIRQVIVTALLRSHNWFVYFDSTILTEADCSRDGDGNDGRRWVDGYCGDLWIFSYDEDEAIGDLIDTQSNPAVTQSNEKFKAMQDTDDQSYGLASYGGVDLEDVYKNALACALAYPDGDGAPNLANLEIVGDYPLCFFSYPVIRGIHYPATSDEYIVPPEDEPYINTSGREQDSSWS